MEQVYNEILQVFAQHLDDLTPEAAAAWDAEIKKQEDAEALAKKIERYHRSGAPQRYWLESLDTYVMKTQEQKNTAVFIKKFCVSVQKQEFKTLVLLGPAGTGKTHLACGVVREAGGLYRNVFEIVEELRRAKSFDSKQTEKDIIDFYANCRFLVLDEIGRGINATDEKYVIYMIINARYNTRKPTLIISNHRKIDFLDYIGAAAADRLTESADIIELSGASYRRELRE